MNKTSNMNNFETSCSEDFGKDNKQEQRTIDEINKGCEEKLKDVNNQMLADILTKHADKLDDARKKMIEKAMKENNEYDLLLKGKNNKQRYMEEYFMQNVINLPIDSDYVNGVDFVCSNNYLVNIKENFTTTGFIGIEVRYFYNGGVNNIHVGLFEREREGFILPEYLEKAWKNGSRFTITKQILNKHNEVLYSIVYRECSITGFKDPQITYDDITPRVFAVDFNYTNYRYEYPETNEGCENNKKDKTLLND